MTARRRFLVRMCAILNLLLTLALSVHPPATVQALIDVTAPSASDPSPTLVFIENAGQFADGARFQVQGRDQTVWLAEDAIWLTLFDQDTGRTAGSPHTHGGGMNVKLSFPGANPHPRLEPFNRLETHVCQTTTRFAQWRQ